MYFCGIKMVQIDIVRYLYFHRYIIFEKKVSKALVDTSCIPTWRRRRPAKFLLLVARTSRNIEQPLSLAVETIFRPAKLRCFVVCFITVLPLVLGSDELSITSSFSFSFRPLLASRSVSFQTCRPFFTKEFITPFIRHSLPRSGENFTPSYIQQDHKRSTYIDNTSKIYLYPRSYLYNLVPTFGITQTISLIRLKICISQCVETH